MKTLFNFSYGRVIFTKRLCFSTRSTRDEFANFVEKVLPKETQVGNVNLTQDEQNGTAIVCIENPTSLNAMTGRMMLDFEEVTHKLKHWRHGKLVLLKGKNKQFCSGGDLKNFMNHLKTPELGYTMSCFMHKVMQDFSKLPIPTVALIEGQTLGGGAEVLIIH